MWTSTTMLSCLKSHVAALAAACLLASAAHAQPQITFTFDNVEVATVDGTNFVEFDVMASSSQSAGLGDALVYINYNEELFGTTIASRGDVVVTPGVLTQNDLVYGLAVNDNLSEGASKISIYSEYKQYSDSTSTYASIVDGTPKALYHVRMKTVTKGALRLSFDDDCSDGPCMEGEQFQSNRDPFGSVTAGADFYSATAAGIEDRFPDSVVRENTLTPAYPNPFNPQTNFSVGVLEDQNVRVAVYNLLGQRVAVLHDGWMPGGKRYDFTFDAAGYPSGAYLVHVSGASISKTQQITLLK